MNQLKISGELKKKVMEKAAKDALTEGGGQPLVLRGHHMLCMQLFRGEGYSDGFSRGMTSVIERIRNNPSGKLKLIRQPDEICTNCPNLVNGNQCSLSNQDVVEKDEGVFRALGFAEEKQEETIYSYEELYQLLRRNMTKAAFEEICGTCRWHKAGLCSWELLSESFEQN